MLILAFMFAALSAHAHGRFVERYVICEGVLKSPAAPRAVVPKTKVTGLLDRWLTTWPVYRSNDPRANLILLVTSKEWHQELPVELIQKVGVNGLFPGQSLHRDIDSRWISGEDVPLIATEFKMNEQATADLATRLKQPADVSADHVDSITYIEDPGAAFENLWSEPTLRFVHFDSDEQIIHHRDTSLLLGQRATLRSPADWIARPLELIAEHEPVAGGAGLPPSAVAKIAAIYVAVPFTYTSTRQ